jgi:hypothetical protein
LIHPLQCRRCAANFYQSGLSVRVIGLLALPTTAMGLGVATAIRARVPQVPEAAAVALGVTIAFAVILAVVLSVVNRRYPLKQSPKDGA